MKKLTGNEDFLRINQKVNIFDIIGCKEKEASKIIAWLLNPRESHGFGNRFFEAMLNAASSNSQLSGYKYNARKVEPSRKQKQTLLDVYQNVIVQTEYCVDKQCKDKEGRVDILLCLEDAKALFVIENKYGSQEHGEQTKKYFKYFSKAQYRSYTVFYIYLDSEEYFEDDMFGISDDEEHWYFLGYDWIVDFLKSKKNKSYDCKSIKKIINDVYIKFSGNYHEEAYYKEFYKKVNELRKNKEFSKAPLNKYIIGHCTEDDVDAYNYARFYDEVGDGFVWQDCLSDDSDNSGKYRLLNGDNNFLGYVANKRMYITSSEIANKYLKNNNGKEWPIYLTAVLEQTDDQTGTQKGTIFLGISVKYNQFSEAQLKEIRSLRKKLKFDRIAYNKWKGNTEEVQKEVVGYLNSKECKDLFAKVEEFYCSNKKGK